MVLMHLIMPAAGRMCLKTMSSGIFNTKRSSALSVRRLTRMLVPKPKKAFQSPGTQILGLAMMLVMDGRWWWFWKEGRAPMRHGSERPKRGENFVGVRDPAEDAALRLDHLQARLLEFGKVGADAILG